MTIDQVQRLIRDVTDFPKPGIVFKDITPVLENKDAFQALILLLAEKIHPQTTHIVAIESRGFILGAALAQKMNLGLVLVRKPGKLPRDTFKKSYTLEYGTDSLEMHKDSLKAGDRVCIVDDVLATGGTAQAVEELCLMAQAQVLGHLFLMEISFLKGALKLKAPPQSLLSI